MLDTDKHFIFHIFTYETKTGFAALYYDGLSRIVPYGYTPRDSDFISALNSETHFIRSICPAWESDEIAESFLEFAKQHLFRPEKRSAMAAKLGAQLPAELAVLHSSKFDLGLLYELSLLGLAQYPDDVSSREWIELEPLTGALYMTFLANHMAERRGLPVVTDNPHLEPLLRDFQSDGQPSGEAALALASMVIETAIPAEIEKLSLRQIVDFRKFSEVQRLKFYEAIREFSKDIQALEDPRAYEEQLRRKHILIRNAVGEVEMCCRNAQIGFVTGLLGVSIPTWSVALSRTTGLSAAPIVAVGGMVIGMAVQKYVELNRARANSPWSYVLSLKKNLRKEDFLRQLQSGAILV